MQFQTVPTVHEPGVEHFEMVVPLPMVLLSPKHGVNLQFTVRAALAHFDGEGWAVGLSTFGPPDLDLFYRGSSFTTRAEAEAFIVRELKDLLGYVESPAALMTWYAQTLDVALLTCPMKSWAQFGWRLDGVDPDTLPAEWKRTFGLAMAQVVRTRAQGLVEVLSQTWPD